MDLAERETLICINRADLADGFFTVATSEPAVAKRLEARAKRAKAWMRTAIDHDAITKAPVYWTIYVDAACLSTNWLPVKAKRSGNAEALRKARAALDKPAA